MYYRRNIKPYRPDFNMIRVDSPYINSKYKDNKPTYDEFNINTSEVTDIKNMYSEYSKFKNDVELKEQWLSKKTFDLENEVKKREKFIFLLSIGILIFLSILLAYIMNNKSILIIFIPPLGFIPFSIVYNLFSYILLDSIKQELENKRNFYLNYYESKLENKYSIWIDKYQKLLQYEQAMQEYNYFREQKSISFWQNMSGRDFEVNIAKLFSENNYNVHLTKGGADGGIDIVVEKDSKKYAVQCKAHKTKISESVARDLYGVLHQYNYAGGFLICLNGVSHNTLDFCKKINDKPIVVLELADILKIISGEYKL